MNAYKETVAETERVKERRRASVEGGVRDVRVEPRNGEQVADRHAVASGEDERQHDENILRAIQAHPEQLYMLRRTVQSEQEATNSAPA